MKRIVFIAMILCFSSGLFAQKDTTFYKHEVRVSLGPSIASTLFWLLWSGNNEEICLLNYSISYYYRPVKWFWVGGNFVNYFGEKLEYNWREYDENGHFKDFSESKIKYCAVIAPEIRFSFLNKKSAILYSALSAGVGVMNGYNTREQKYPKILPYFHITFFGFNCNFGEKKNGFIGSEFGIGCKNLLQIHGGYRF